MALVEPEDIQEILDRRDWIPADLANACFVTRATVYNWLERGCTTQGMARRLQRILKNARRRDGVVERKAQ